MNTQIKLTYDDVEYVLEYNRQAIKTLEALGFNYDTFMTKPLTNIELAFSALFIKNHPKVTQATIDKIYKGMGNKEKLIQLISTMIDECYASLLEEPEEGSSGNVTWEVVNLAPKKKVQE